MNRRILLIRAVIGVNSMMPHVQLRDYLTAGIGRVITPTAMEGIDFVYPKPAPLCYDNWLSKLDVETI